GGRVRRTHRLAVLHHPRPVLEYEHWRPRLTQIIAWDGEAVRILRNHYARRIVSRLDEYERRDSVFLPVHERRGDDQNAVHGPVVRPQRAIRRPPRTPREPRLDNLKAERRGPVEERSVIAPARVPPLVIDQVVAEPLERQDGRQAQDEVGPAPPEAWPAHHHQGEGCDERNQGEPQHEGNAKRHP